jgi:hypothetical protein
MNSIRRLLIAASTLTAAWAWSPSALALGLGQAESQATLGDTLRVVVPLRLEVGEVVTRECVAAEVSFGDDRVPATAVDVDLQPAETVTAGMGARLVVRTTALINEPVVHVQVHAGCQARISRRFVALADPPGHQAATSLAQGSRSPTPETVLPASAAAPTADPIRRKPARAKASSPDAITAATATATSTQREAGVASRQTARQAARARPTAKAPAEAPRLALDPVDADAWVQPSLRSSGQMSSPIEAVDAASSEVQARREAAAALWRALNATPEAMLRQQRHVEELEQKLQALQKSGETTQQSVAALQARMQALEKIETSTRSAWGWKVWLALLAGAAGLIWLVHSLGVRRGRQQAATWWSPETGQPPLNVPDSEDTHSRPHLDDDLLGPVPEPDDSDRLPPLAVRPASEPAPASPSPSPLPFSQPSFALSDAAPLGSLLGTEPLKAVSVEELIDLEQQAEFFIVLGQDNAAIQLLESHLGGHTQVIPWPYLKLMEVYRRLGRRADYERIQERFNTHFNGRAPTWESDMEQGRSLVDYPGVIERLQALWAEPTRAMDVLEMSLVHLGPDADAFDLPAYRELLFLYAVARDLSDRAERRQPASTEISPLTATQPVRRSDLGAPAVEPLAVDLDLDRLDDR